MSGIWKRRIVVLALATAVGVGVRVSVEPTEKELMTQAQLALATGKTATAEQLARRTLISSPLAFEARWLLAQIASRKDDVPTALVNLRSIPEGRPYAFEARMGEGNAWVIIGQARKAEEAWRNAERLRPVAEARGRLLYLYGIQLRRRDWKQLLWQMLDEGQADFKELTQLMIAEAVVWEPDGTLPTLRKFVAADNEDWPSRRAVVDYLIAMGRVQEAVAAGTELTTEQPSEPENWLALFRAQIASAQPAVFSAAFESASGPVQAALERDGRIHLLRGDAAQLLGKQAEAVVHFRAALKAAPYHNAANHKLSLALRLIGDEGAAGPLTRIAAVLSRIERSVNSLETSNKWTAEEIRRLALECASVGLVEEARAWIRFTLSHSPDDDAAKRIYVSFESLPTTSKRRPGLQALDPKFFRTTP